MCRSIKQLRRPAEPPTEAEIQAAALQFVRKISGYRVPSKTNKAAFDAAVAEITAATSRLLTQISPVGTIHLDPTIALDTSAPLE